MGADCAYVNKKGACAVGKKQKVRDKLKCKLYDMPKLNWKLACMKKSLDEVEHILNPRCKC